MSETQHEPHLSSPDRRPKQELRADLELVMSAINYHKTSRRHGPWTGEAKHPIFDDIGQYGASHDQMEQLWALEAKRLLEVADNTEAPLVFRGGSHLGEGTLEGFQKLSTLVEYLTMNRLLCAHDNDLLVLEFCDELFDPEFYRRHKSGLNHLFENPNLNKRSTELPPDELEEYFALVDYITAVVARIALETATSEFYHSHCLATLAKWSVKSKYLMVDPVRFAGISLNAGQEIMESEETTRHIESGRNQHHDSDQGGNSYDVKALQQGSAMQKAFAADDDVDTKLYFIQMVMMHVALDPIINSVIYSLSSKRDSGSDSNAFEISSLVYGTGFGNHPTLLSQDRDGDFGASSSSTGVQNSYIAFRTLLQTTALIRTRSSLLPSQSSNPEARASVEWEIDVLGEEDLGQSGSLVTSNMADIVSIMVPLVCTGAPASGHFVHMVRIFSMIAESKDPVETCKEMKYTALYSMKTDAFEKSRPPLKFDDTRPLSSSLVSHQRLLISSETPSSTTNDWNMMPAITKQQLISETQQSFQRLDAKIAAQWTIDQESVTIKCEVYVLAVMSACMILVLGGVGIGASIGERISGVDPFNIATFCWLIAAFTILVAKSVYVENWPWRDFLLRRVVCRRVSELSSVSGVSEQDIITYLLHNEQSTILNTKGPYNAVFLRQGNEGFAIDVKPLLRTMLRSGLIVVKVATLHGPALVSLNVRKGKDFVGLGNSDQREDHHHLACTDLQSGERGSTGQELTLQRVRLGWNKVLGLYNLPNSSFR
ncbi:hypothetical protein IFR04_010473 [Cadophora malorum]|uniref:Uncharacterized protein n=1 Tax=Cadophora malorum TaxID=108018 RepID=A0A8H7W5U3_9HELO|nr:hypothetical protein IFR04_010473 [Cadophora malorum]